MHQRTSCFYFGLLICVQLVLMGSVHPALGQYEEYPRLGLSASPDSVVSDITVAPGAAFDLHMIAVGPDVGGPLPLAFSSLQWIVRTGCCGVVFDVLNVDYNPLLDHVGSPVAGVVSAVHDCLEEEIVRLATITFRILHPTSGIAMMPAGASGPGLDCDAGSLLCFDLLVNVHLDDSVVSDVPDQPPPDQEGPPETSSWGEIKATYRR